MSDDLQATIDDLRMLAEQDACEIERLQAAEGVRFMQYKQAVAADEKVVQMFRDFLLIAGPPGPEALQRLRRAGRQDLIDWALGTQQEIA